MILSINSLDSEVSVLDEFVDSMQLARAPNE
jgi:hypothetical protein